jgi:predicted DNA-binding transcriptional regulator AlpA
MSDVAVASQRYVLPYLPLGLRRVEAAAYVGVSPSKFDEMVHDKRMPKPIHIDGRRVWDRRKIEEAFAQLGEEGEGKRRSLADLIE